MFLRILIAALIVYVIWRLWRKAGRPSATGGPEARLGAGEMVACDRCGTFVIKSEAISNGDHYYCSESCHKLN